jgi:hypothetical protein
MAFGDSDPVVSFVLYSRGVSVTKRKKNISIKLLCIFLGVKEGGGCFLVASVNQSVAHYYALHREKKTGMSETKGWSPGKTVEWTCDLTTKPQLRTCQDSVLKLLPGIVSAEGVGGFALEIPAQCGCTTLGLKVGVMFDGPEAMMVFLAPTAEDSKKAEELGTENSLWEQGKSPFHHGITDEKHFDAFRRAVAVARKKKKILMVVVDRAWDLSTAWCRELTELDDKDAFVVFLGSRHDKTKSYPLDHALDAHAKKFARVRISQAPTMAEITVSVASL